MLEVAWQEHDHDDCVATALARAQRLCAGKGVRFTQQRRQVLELVWNSHRPIGAYAILELYRQLHGATAPVTIYRALDFLLAQGLIHRIASHNAFVGCRHPGAPHAGSFLLCSDCGVAQELHAETIDAAIAHDAREQGFCVQSQVVEVSGLCPRCQDGAGPGG